MSFTFASVKAEHPLVPSQFLMGLEGNREIITPRSGKLVWTKAAVKDDLRYIRANIRPCWKCVFGGFLFVCAAIFFICAISMSVERVDAKHYAVAYSPITGRIEKDVKSEGLHAKPAFGSFILWPKTYATRSESIFCNSKDGVRIQLLVTFQYLPRETSIYDLTKLYEDDEGYKSVLKKHARSAIRNSCAIFTTQEFQTKRAQVQLDIYDRLLVRLGKYMETDVIDVQLSNIQRPREYEAEVDAKEQARNDIDQAENERDQALTRAKTVLLQAYSSANKTVNTAETNAENMLVEARAKAEVIRSRYQALAASYSIAKRLHNFTDGEVLAYVANRLVGETSDTTVALDPLTTFAL